MLENLQLLYIGLFGRNAEWLGRWPSNGEAILRNYIGVD